MSTPVNRASAAQSKTPSAPPKTRRAGGSYYGNGKRGEQKHLTDYQAKRIAILEKLISWNEQSTLKFIYRQIGQHKGVSMLMNYQASKVIIGMQRIFAGNNKVNYAAINNMNNEQLSRYETPRNISKTTLG